MCFVNNDIKLKNKIINLNNDNLNNDNLDIDNLDNENIYNFNDDEIFNEEYLSLNKLFKKNIILLLVGIINLLPFISVDLIFGLKKNLFENKNIQSIILFNSFVELSGFIILINIINLKKINKLREISIKILSFLLFTSISLNITIGILFLINRQKFKNKYTLIILTKYFINISSFLIYINKIFIFQF